MSAIKGRRIYPGDDGVMWYAPGDYGKDPRDGHWYARPPTSSDKHLTGCLRAHEVTEHADGTITVTPSILITGYDDDCAVLWHGYLTNGEWTEC